MGSEIDIIPCKSCILLPICYNKFLFSEENKLFRDYHEFILLNTPHIKEKLKVVGYSGNTNYVIITCLFEFIFNEHPLYYSFELPISCKQLLKLFIYDLNGFIRQNISLSKEQTEISTNIINFYIELYLNRGTLKT